MEVNNINMKDSKNNIKNTNYVNKNESNKNNTNTKNVNKNDSENNKITHNVNLNLKERDIDSNNFLSKVF